MGLVVVNLVHLGPLVGLVGHLVGYHLWLVVVGLVVAYQLLVMVVVVVAVVVAVVAVVVVVVVGLVGNDPNLIIAVAVVIVAVVAAAFAFVVDGIAVMDLNPMMTFDDLMNLGLNLTDYHVNHHLHLVVG